MVEPRISVLVCSIDAAKYARVTANYQRLLSGYPHEIIGIHDARSLAEGYNRAVQKSRGELLIFSHDDVEIVSGDLAPAIARASASLDVIGVVGTSKVLSGYWPAAGHPFLHGWLAQPAPDGGSACTSACSESMVHRPQACRDSTACSLSPSAPWSNPLRSMKRPSMAFTDTTSISRLRRISPGFRSASAPKSR